MRRALRTTIGTLGALLLSGCAAHLPEPPQAPNPPQVAALGPAESGSVTPTPAALPQAVEAPAAAQAAPPPIAPLATAAPAPEPNVAARVACEAPYKTFLRPRPAGPVFAAGEDEALARWNLGGTGDPSFISNRSGFHPGARVVVDTELVAGQLPAKSGPGLSQRALLAQSRSRGYWPLRLCYEDALRRSPKLSGETRIRFTLAPSGNVTRAEVRSTALDEEAGRCLTLAVENLSYHPGPARGLVAVDLSVKFWRGDAPVPAIGPASGTVFENPGRLEPEAVSSVMASALPAIEACYSRGTAQDPLLWGRLGVRVDLSPEGAIDSVQESESRFPDAEVSACVVATVETLKFPAPTGGALSFVQAFRLGTPPAEPEPEPEPDPQAGPSPAALPP